MKFTSPVVTRLQSDTIFGHICWAISFINWGKENKLTNFLSAYENEGPPPLLVSNGFPKGFLPKPLTLPITQDQIDEAVGIENRIEKAYKIKMAKRPS